MASNPEAIVRAKRRRSRGQHQAAAGGARAAHPRGGGAQPVRCGAGAAINVPLLEQELGIPVIPTVAVKREGFDEITAKLGEVLAAKQETPAASPCAACSECCKGRAALDYWERAREIVGRVVKNIEKNPSKLDQFGDMLLTPWPGIALALLITLLSLGAVVGAGKALRSVLLLPLVNQGIVPLFEKLFSSMAMPVMLRNVLIGQYGIFRISFEWILALVMPYVLLFQLVFSFLEDSGILPRMAVLFDNMMRKLGVQGGSLINIMLGYGCAVPAIIGTRAATTKKERLMVTSFICFAVPCISQTGALISLLSEFSYWLLLAVFITGCFVFVMTAIISNKVIKGSVDPLIIEIPNLLIPERRTYFKKFFVRVKQFMVEAEGPMMIAVVIAAIIAETGLLQGISGLLEPLVAGWLGLPPEAAISLILGIIRREMSVAPLLAMDLTGLQMYVGAVVSLVYLPCMSVFAILAKEFNAKVALAITLATTATALLRRASQSHDWLLSSACLIERWLLVLWITKITQRIELLATKSKIIFYLVLLYYRLLVKRETALANIGKDDRVLCIGGGMCPYTAILLHRYTNAKVTVVDNDRHCAEKSRCFLRRMGLGDIHVCHGDGRASTHDYTVIHVAMQVSPKDAVVSRIVKEAPNGARVLVRMPKHCVKSLYCNFNKQPFRFDPKSSTAFPMCTTPRFAWWAKNPAEDLYHNLGVAV